METAENHITDKKAPAKETQELDMFVGKWNVEGKNLKGVPIGAEALVRGIATYEWLAGKHYLINKWSRKFDGSTHIGIGIIGMDETSATLVANHYDNIGFSRSYQVILKRLTWKFSGKNERASIEFTPDGKTFTEYWEVSADGTIWEPLCKLTGTKVF
jgi:hypothetical protein